MAKSTVCLNCGTPITGNPMRRDPCLRCGSTVRGFRYRVTGRGTYFKSYPVRWLCSVWRPNGNLHRIIHCCSQSMRKGRLVVEIELLVRCD